MAYGRLCGEREDPGRQQGRVRRFEVVMDADVRHVVVVEAGPLQVGVVHREAQWPGQVQRRAGDRGQPDGGAGVVRDARGVEEDADRAGHAGQFLTAGCARSRPARCALSRPARCARWRW
ncbi:hypothetical protein SDC9_135291 [bioreactor metagenome]|uniref:Uncharacterized protein n=1 Tax=bioreactor metagenome TaxID=1076179 RepID=A0A645DFC9_9ZZZZ